MLLQIMLHTAKPEQGEVSWRVVLLLSINADALSDNITFQKPGEGEFERRVPFLRVEEQHEKVKNNFSGQRKSDFRLTFRPFSASL